MKLDNYALQQLAPFMTGHKDHGANFTGRELVDLFNKYGGLRDVYDNGLPVIQKGLNTAKKTYAEDRLKKINDSRGHHEGDKLLRAFGDILTKCFSDVGDVIRPGGDEFLIISDDASDHELVSRLTWLPELEREAEKTLGFPVTAAYPGTEQTLHL